MGTQTTLRYALNLISTAQVLARKRKSAQVDVEDLRRAYAYFMDEKRSVQWLKEQQGTLVFEEVGGETEESMGLRPAWTDRVLNEAKRDIILS